MRRRIVMRGAALLPVAGPIFAQKAPVRPRLIGFITPSPWQRPWLEPFITGMRDLGWADGNDFILEQRVTGPEFSRARRLAIELRDQGAEILVTSTTNIAIEVSGATPSLPVVMGDERLPRGGRACCEPATSGRKRYSVKHLRQ